MPKKSKTMDQLVPPILPITLPLKNQLKNLPKLPLKFLITANNTKLMLPKLVLIGLKSIMLANTILHTC
jgi:hypothetical protein